MDVLNAAAFERSATNTHADKVAVIDGLVAIRGGGRGASSAA